MTYYKSELARIHHEAFGDYADLVASGVVSRLADRRTLVELGCGSGSLTRHLLEAGHTVLATDASPAMLDLAIREVPEANPRLLELPDDPIPSAEAVVALGHVFNYLASEDEIAKGLTAAAAAGDLFLTDMLDVSYGESRPEPVEFHHEGEGWNLWTVNRLETPRLVVRKMTIETETGVTNEIHRNVLVDVAEMASTIRGQGHNVSLSRSFGDETLPPGFLVLEVTQA